MNTQIGSRLSAPSPRTGSSCALGGGDVRRVGLGRRRRRPGRPALRPRGRRVAARRPPVRRRRWWPASRPAASAAGRLAGVAAEAERGASLLQRFSRCSGISVTASCHDRRGDHVGDAGNLGAGAAIATGDSAPTRRVPTGRTTCARSRAHVGERDDGGGRLHDLSTRPTGDAVHETRASVTSVADDSLRRTTHRPRRKGRRQRDASPSTILQVARHRTWPSSSSFFVTIAHDAGRHPVRQAPARRHAALVGRGDDRRGLRLRRDVPRLRRRAPPVDRPRRQEPRLDQATSIIYGPGGILKPQAAGGWIPITLQYEAVRDIVVVAHPRRTSSGSSSSCGAGGRSAARPSPAPRSPRAPTAVRW